MALTLQKDGRELVVETAADLEGAIAAGWEHPDPPTGDTVGAAKPQGDGEDGRLEGEDAQLAEARTTITRLEQELEDASGQSDRSAAALKKARDETKAEKKRVETLERERDGLKAEVEQLNAKLADAVKAAEAPKDDAAPAKG
jgi:predicted  nucleic acid-binding Zn-ribbon protein